MTDEAGTFVLPSHYQQGDSLLFSRIGYRQQVVVIGEKTPWSIVVILPTLPVDLDSVAVAVRVGSSGPGILLRQVERVPELGAVEHRRLWSAVPGLYLKSYGGPAGISTVSLDGSPATHTKIVIAGFDLTSAQNGQLDISQLPPAFIKSIDYFPHQAGRFSAENSEGILDVTPQTAASGMTLALGSYGKLQLNAGLNLQKKSWTSHLLIGHNQYRGDYEVCWRDERFKRRNNHFAQDFFNWQGSILFNSRAFARLIVFYSEQKRGVAGLVWNPSENARRQDALGFAGLKVGWNRKTGYASVQILHRQSFEHYFYPTIAIDSRHRVRTDQIIFSTSRTAGLVKWGITTDLKRDYLSSRQAGEHHRTTWTNLVTTNFPLLKPTELRPWLKIESASHLYSQMTCGGQLAYCSKGWVELLAASWGYYYSYPTFNDLYWKPGGNPNLKPDETIKYEVDVVLKWEQWLGLSLNGYYKTDKNLIQWTPVQSYWQPTNLSRADRRGVKIILNWALPGVPLTGYFQAVLTRSRNLTQGDNYLKALRYTPEESFTAGLNYTRQRLSCQLMAEYVGARIAMYSWPEDVILNAYWLTNASIAYRINTKRGFFTLVLAGDNLTNQIYESVQGYPEPGRAFTGTVEYHFK